MARLTPNLARTAAGAAALVAAALAAPVAADVHEVRGDGFIVRHAITVPAAPLASWLMLTKPADWWSDDHTWSGDATNMTLVPQGGGCWCERIPAAKGDAGDLAGSAAHGIVIQASPLRLLRLDASLGPLQSEPARGVLTFALKPADGGGTVIQVEYNVGGSMRFKPAEMAPVVDKVLGLQMSRLGEKLGARPGASRDAAPAGAAKPDAPAPTIEAEIDALGT